MRQCLFFKKKTLSKQTSYRSNAQHQGTNKTHFDRRCTQISHPPLPVRWGTGAGWLVHTFCMLDQFRPCEKSEMCTAEFKTCHSSRRARALDHHHWKLTVPGLSQCVRRRQRRRRRRWSKPGTGHNITMPWGSRTAEYTRWRSTPGMELRSMVRIIICH